jgi:hypothetical protein
VRGASMAGAVPPVCPLPGPVQSVDSHTVFLKCLGCGRWFANNWFDFGGDGVGR